MGKIDSQSKIPAPSLQTNVIGSNRESNSGSWISSSPFSFAFSVWSEVKATQSCLTLCNLMGYTVHGILQATILKWVAFPFSRGSSQPRDRTQVSCIAGGFFTSWARGNRGLYWGGGSGPRACEEVWTLDKNSSSSSLREGCYIYWLWQHGDLLLPTACTF